MTTYYHYDPWLDKKMEIVHAYGKNKDRPVYRNGLDALAVKLKERVRNGYQNVIAVTGRTGSGKSTTAIQLAYAMDRNWSLEANYIYSADDLRGKLRAREYANTISLFDECSVSLSSKNAMRNDDKTLVVLFDTMRSLGWTSILCIPNINALNRAVREDHVDIMIRCPERALKRGYDARGFIEVYEHIFRTWGEPYYKFRFASTVDKLPPSIQKKYDAIKLEHQLMILREFVDEKEEKNGSD